MMKWILIGVGVLVLLVIGVAGLGWVAANRSIDPNTQTGQAYAEGFKKEFAESCISEAVKAAGADAALEQQIRELCECGAEATYDEYKDEPPIKLISIGTDPEAQQRISEIMQDCAEQAGLQ
jgi:hypothetical protein